MGSEVDSSVVPLAATVVPGSGRLHVLVNCDAIWEEGVKVAVVCVRRLRQRLGMRDLWGQGLDLYLGAPYGYLALTGHSSGLAVAAALVLLGTDAKGLWGWGMTGVLSLDGRVARVESVRTKAVGAWKAGLKGMIVPRSNLDDLKGDDWPGGESPSETLRQQWAEAREQLVFRGVDTVEELLAFFFPSLAPLLTASGSSVRRSARCAPEVGPIASVGLPVPDKAWPGLAYAEACVLRGVSASPWPEVIGGFPRTAPHDVQLAWHLVLQHVSKLEAVTRTVLGRTSGVRQGRVLAHDPRKLGDHHIFVKLDAPTTGPGLMVLPIFLALSALVMGLKVRKDCSVFSFCTVSGVLVRVGTAMTELMAAALRNGVRTLLLADDDEEDVREAARACGLEVRPAALVADLLNPDIFEASD